MSNDGYRHHHVSAHTHGETCALCRAPATHKIEESKTLDDPLYYTRNHPSAYVCCKHYMALFPEDHVCEEKKKP